MRSPKGTYLLAVGFTAQDNVAGNAVSYTFSVSAGSTVWTRTGRTTSGRVAVTLRIRPPKGVRRLRLSIMASDPLDNTRQLARSLTLPAPL